jgi:hypothetical protein
VSGGGMNSRRPLALIAFSLLGKLVDATHCRRQVV